MKSPQVSVACLLLAVLAFASVRAEDEKPTPMYYRVKPMVDALKVAGAAKDEAKAEQISREILSLPMDPAERTYLAAQMSYALDWLNDNDRLEAWLEDAERELATTPKAKHLLWFQARGWEYRNRFKLEGSSFDLGKAKSPVWLRLKRAGDHWTAAMSADGKKWTEKEIPGWKADKPCLWGIASAQIPPRGTTLPSAFEAPALEPSLWGEMPWTFEHALRAGDDFPPEPDPAAPPEARPIMLRMDALVDEGWLLHREVEGNATLTMRLKLPEHCAGGLRVALGQGHHASRLYLSHDRDGMVRCSVRHHDTRGAMAWLRLAHLCPEELWLQLEAAEQLVLLGLADPFPLFEHAMDRDFVATMARECCGSVITSYLRAGREEELTRRFLAWRPKDAGESSKVPFAAYSYLANQLAEKERWDLSLRVAHRGMEMSKPKDYYFRRLALHAVKCLEAMNQTEVISAVILDGLFGRAVDDSRGQAGTAPPHWNHSSGQRGDDGPWNEYLGLLFAAEKYKCGGEVWDSIRKVIPGDSKDKLDRMDRVLAGIAAQDPAVMEEWQSLIDHLKVKGVGDDYFIVGAATLLERWKGHDGEAMETWLTGAYIDLENIGKPRRVRSSSGEWQADLFMAEGAVRSALKAGDVETARLVITVLNQRYSANPRGILDKVQFIAPGMRLLENAVEQKKPELTKLLLPTMEEIISKAKEPYPRSRREWLEKIKKQVGEEK